MNTLLALATLAATASLAASAPGDHLIVDHEGSAPFLTIQGAVDAASSGDVILVRPPRNPEWRLPGFTVVGKALTIRAAGTVPVRTRAIRVESLAPDDIVTIRGLAVLGRGSADLGDRALSVAHSTGSVRIQDCTFDRSNGVQATPTVALHNSLDVVFTDCSIKGGVGSESSDAQNLHEGGAGLHTTASRVTLARTTVTGGTAGSAIAYSSFIDTPAGGTAIEMTNRSVAWIEGASLLGGAGFSVSCHSGCGTLEGGDGGPGAVVEAGSILMRLDSSVEGGPGGDAALGWTNVPGETGPPLIGSESVFGGRVRNLDLPDSVYSEAPVPVRVTGVPGEAVTLWATELGGFRALGGAGVLGVRGFDPSLTFDLGVVPASGVLQSTVQLPVIGDREASTFTLQAGLRDGGGALRLSFQQSVTVKGPGLVAPTSGDVIYVAHDAPAGGDGTSWSSAVNDLAGLLRVLPFVDAASPIRIWVKEGTYRASVTGNSAASFVLGSGWQILGGFRGDETAAAERDPLTRRTVLDGDLNGDDQPGFGMRSDNTRRVLKGADITLDGFFMDGFVIRGAEGDSAAAIAGTATFHRCVFEENRALGSSASALSYARTTSFGQSDELCVQRCVFQDNWSAYLGAVDLTLWFNAARFHGCLFARNHKQTYSAGTRAVAMNVAGGSNSVLEITNCTFADNSLQPNLWYQSCIAMDSFGAATIVNTVFGETTNPSGPVGDIWGLSPTEHVLEYNCFARPLTGVSATNQFSAAGFVGPTDYRLAPGSTLIDAGDNTRVPESYVRDLDGDWRFKDDPGAPNVGVGGIRIVDIGAFER